MAAEHMKTWTIGNVKVTRIVELNNHVDPLSVLLKDGSPELMKKYDWLFPNFATPAGDMIISFQCFVVQTPRRRIMVDTCIGNGRWREHPVFVNMQTSFLEDITRAGCPPESIDTVLCTHMHFDHVGWNTRKVNGQWVPTFPNARYLISTREWNHWKQVPRDGTVHAQHLVDSIQPVLDAGLVVFVASDHRIARELRLFPTPGHTPGHVSVAISSQGEKAVITGDLMHHPIQIAEPDLLANFCIDAKKACRTRRKFVTTYQNRKVFILGSHFCDPTGGWIIKDEKGWRFETGK
jgi:glyoxylase-like metal-dependent hydrolase (beta-lactamase superfamily II)